MFKTRFISMLVLLAAVATGAWAQNYTITLPSVSNGSVTAKVNDTPVTSAAAGETVSLVATPDAGYGLKSISGVYSETVSETFSSGANTRTGTYFSVSGSNYAYGWRVGNSYTLTISSLSNQNLSQVVLTVGTAPNVSQRNISHLQADHGTLSATGTTQGNTITITGINSPTVTVSAPSSGNSASMWTITQAKIDGLGSVALTLTDTGDDNVKTFTMPSGNVTISAEFESAVVAVNSITLSQTEATLTLGETETVTLIPTVLPAEATDKSVTWSSSDEAVATVTDGIVTAVGAGEATITVTTTDGAKTATCAVTVAAPAASTYTVTLKEGTEDATSWTIAPPEATTTGVAAGTEVKATYGGTKKVKSVKAVKKAAPAAKAAAEATAEDKGKLIGTDGKIYADVAAATAAGTTAVAKIIYIGTTGHATYSHGLALALTDEGHMTWGAAMTACNTTKNTNTPVTGATWLLASKDQWNYMLGTSGAGSYTALRDGFSGITGASNLQSSGLYWSSTEDDDRAWYLRFSNGNWQLGVKSNTNFYVRACLAF